EEIEKICASLDGMDGVSAIPWSRIGAFPPGSYTQARLVEMVSLVDAALFVFSPDDKVEFRGEPAMQPRDNVLMEYGLFLGRPPEGSVAFYRRGDARTAGDVDGVTHIAAPNGWNAKVELELKTWIRARRPSWLTPGELVHVKHPAIRVYQTPKT